MRFLKLLKVSIFFAFLLSSLNLSAQTQEWKLMHRGNAAFRARQYEKAQNYYMQALAKNPSSSRALFNLADTYLAKGDAHGADSLYSRVVQAEKNKTIRSMAFHNRGYICQKQALDNQEQKQQLLRQAIELYKQALRLNPKDDDTRYNLVLCQRQLKDDQNNQQKQQQQQQKQEQKQDKQKQQQQNQQQQEQQKQQQNQQNKQQTEQYINLSKQAEREARRKINNQQPRQKSMDKNW